MRRALLTFPGLFAIELRRLLRSWRWRGLVPIALIACYFLDRLQNFGEGSAVALPGGLLGTYLLPLLLGAAALILGVDIVGQLDRHRAAQSHDARPLPALSLTAARIAAVLFGVGIIAALCCFFPFINPFGDAEGLLLAPSVVFLVAVMLPMALLGASAGTLARGWSSSDGGALLLGGILAAPAAWYRLGPSAPGEVLRSASRQLGILVPPSVLVGDALNTILAAVCLAGLACFSLRTVRGRTPLRSTDPPRSAPVPSVSRLIDAVLRLVRGLQPELLVAAALVLVGAVGLARTSAAAMRAFREPGTSEFVADWSRMSEPPGGERGSILAPHILGRRLSVPADDRSPITVELDLRASRSEGQSVAALTFGPTVDVASFERVGAGAVERYPTAASAGLHAMVLRFDPPLDAETTTTLRVELHPRAAAERQWERVRHPAYATFQEVPYWWGEGMTISYSFARFALTEQPAPFTAELPAVGDREWICGTASAVTKGDRTTLTQPLPTIPTGLFAAKLSTVTRTHGPLEVRFVVFPEHEELAKDLQTAYSRRFDRLARALGAGSEAIVYYEVPDATPADPLAIPSSTLERLASLVAKYDDFDQPSAPEFDTAFIRMHRGAVDRLVTRAFAGFERLDLLRDAWIVYLDDYGFQRGQTRLLTRARRDFLLVPWEIARPPGTYPFDLTPRDEPGYRGPILPELRDTSMPRAPFSRMVAFHHLLRGRLGEDNYIKAIRRLIDTRGGKVVRIADWLEAAEFVSGADQKEFFHQWLDVGVVPKYRLREAQVVLAENGETGDLEYTTRATVANDGDGDMMVPIVLDTEGDRVTTPVSLPPGAETSVTFVTRERPKAVAIDPEGWIIQVPPFDTKSNRPMHPILYLKTVKEI